MLNKTAGGGDTQRVPTGWANPPGQGWEQRLGLGCAHREGGSPTPSWAPRPEGSSCDQRGCYNLTADSSSP